jgi:LPXTG-motif cell wall-anchored protein
MITAADGLTFELHGAWAVVLGVILLAITGFLVYRRIRQYRRDRQE